MRDTARPSSAYRKTSKAEAERDEMTAYKLAKHLKEIIKNGRGNQQVYLMEVIDGMTQRSKVVDCFAAEDYDGDFIWILTAEEEEET